MNDNKTDFSRLAQDIRQWAHELGFAAAGISDTDLSADEPHLLDYLAAGYHGEMDYLARHGNKRSRPQELVPGTLRVISLRMEYLPDGIPLHDALQDKRRAYISRYALGRDYHKLIRKRLQQLAERIRAAVRDLNYRVFVDSAPVLESALARNAGLGWIGKNTLLLNRQAGSFFLLGEIFVDIPLPVSQQQADNHCGSCTACLDKCPTGAFVGPYILDARRCISYLTIELKGSIPPELRPLMGNRVFGCDDCQIACPWNRFRQAGKEDDFRPRHNLDSSSLLELFAWSEEEFLQRSQGSPIRRSGYESWLRNLAIGLGNAPASPAIMSALQQRLEHPSSIVREHVQWALKQQGKPDEQQQQT